MGSLVVTVKELLTGPQLVLDQWFDLDGALPESQILLRAELKVRLQTHTCFMINSSLLPMSLRVCLLPLLKHRFLNPKWWT